MRPGFLAARAFQRTSYLPGEIGQLDWWHTVRVPVGKGVEREIVGLPLVGLPLLLPLALLRLDRDEAVGGDAVTPAQLPEADPGVDELALERPVVVGLVHGLLRASRPPRGGVTVCSKW